MEIIGYTYEADIHCVDCAEKKFGSKIDDDINPPTDNEGNEVHPIFSTDEFDICECCGDCGEQIYEV